MAIAATDRLSFATTTGRSSATATTDRSGYSTSSTIPATTTSSSQAPPTHATAPSARQQRSQRRLTSDMISFRTVEIPIANNDDPTAAASGGRRHSNPNRFRSAYKIEAAAAPSPPATSAGTSVANTTLSGGGATVSNPRSIAFPRHSRSRSGGSFGRLPSTGVAGGGLERKFSSTSNTSSMTGALRDQLSIAAPANGGILDATSKPATVWSIFVQTVMRHTDAIALSGHGHNEPEVKYTWVEYYERVHTVAKVLAHLQFASGEGAVICAKSSPELYFLNLAVLSVGGVVSHIRPSWSVDELVDHIFVNTNARILIIDELHDNFVEALRRVKTAFRAIIVLRQDPMDLIVALDNPVTVINMEDLYTLANNVNEIAIDILNDRAAAQACCLVSFGYDEHGHVRGISLSHDNVMFTASSVASSFGPLSSIDRMVGYIPLHHVAAQILEIYMPLVSALSVICAPSYNTPVVKVITRKKPTIFFATPDTWARFSVQVYKAKSDVNSILYRWAKTRATNNSKKLLFGQDAHRSLGYMIAKKLVLNNIKKRIGLESCHACYSVLAPLDFELEKLFKTIDIPIYQVFGCAETTGFAAINYPHAWEFGSSGRALKGTIITCDEVTQEVLLCGRNVFSGYVQNSQTAPSLPRDRWFRFRQRGFLTPNGFLKINDPQDFVVLSTGDWIPVKPYEEALEATEPELDRAVLVGEGRSFLSVLLFMKVNPLTSARMNSKTGGSNSATLSDDALHIGKMIRSPATTVAEAIKCQAWAVHFDKVLEALPEKCGLSGFHIRKWILMADAFTVESGEIDPDTSEVKRKVVDGKYQSLLDSLYT
ncbi:Long-chain-fatty-acid-coa ligase, partial [Globisporangium splendens]